MYAFEELKKELESVKELQFIFTSPAFINEKPKKAQREFYIPRLNRERTLHGSEFEIRLRSEFHQRAISRECAKWIKEKVRFKSNRTMKMFLDSLRLTLPIQLYILPSMTFQSRLGLRKRR